MKQQTESLHGVNHISIQQLSDMLDNIESFNACMSRYYHLLLLSSEHKFIRQSLFMSLQSLYELQFPLREIFISSIEHHCAKWNKSMGASCGFALFSINLKSALLPKKKQLSCYFTKFRFYFICSQTGLTIPPGESVLFFPRSGKKYSKYSPLFRLYAISLKRTKQHHT